MIWARRKLIFWWLVTAALAAGGTAWLVMRWHVHTRHENAAYGLSMQGMHAWLDSTLELTSGQHGKLDRLEQTAGEEQGVARTAILQAERELAESLRAGDENAAAVKEALQRLSTARARLQELVVRHYCEIFQVLDEAQRKAFADWNASRNPQP